MVLDPLTVVVVAANLLGGAMALPQALKLARSRKVHGVSPMWAGISAAVNAWWAVYGLAVGERSIVPVSLVSVMAYLAIAGAIVRFGASPPRRSVTTMLAGGAAVAIVPLIAWSFGGWPVAGVTLGALYGVQLSPAVVAVYRAPDVSGVSRATWGIAAVEAVLWGVYGLARVDAGLVTLAVTGLVMSALVLVRLFVRRPQPTRSVELALAPV